MSAVRKASTAAPHDVLATPVSALGNVTRAALEQLDRLGIRTVRDLIRHYPARYDDLRNIVRIAGLATAAPGETNIVGVITQFRHVRLRGRIRSKSTALVEDGSGMLSAVWFGRPYLGTQLKAGMRIFLRGRVEQTLSGPKMSVIAHRVLAEDEAFEGGLEPVYPLTAGLQNRTVRRLVGKALRLALAPSVAAAELDPLPASIGRSKRFPDARWALRAIHQPRDPAETDEARRRLIFEEFFLLSTATALRRAARSAEPAPAVGSAVDDAAWSRIRAELPSILPFAPTAAQSRVIEEVAADMRRPAPMNRLLQGDVGSGKTAVAAAAVLLAARAGFQSAFMAPTEILAMQQFEKLSALLSRAGLRCGSLTGGLRRSSRADMIEALRAGDIDVVVGTHALITDDVAFARLGLVVIDEQHRFGVMQRAALRAKGKGHTPHTLVMTATPIPRTLAQSVYADLDVSIIDELPPGRTPVKTYVRSADSKPKIFAFVRGQVDLGRQAFVVCPAIEESERAVHSAEREAERLSADAFAGLRVKVLHGKMTAAHKDEIMRLFRDGFIQILISTTVVEVGVDIPNATVMVVLDAHVFGLAQLHQLRGRVGRGGARSYCVLVAPDGAAEAARLDVLASTNDGFRVADEDMKLRGAGDLAGVRQHGGDDFKLADLIRDFPIFMEAKEAATAIVAADPELRRPEHAALAAYLASVDRDATMRASS